MTAPQAAFSAGTLTDHQFDLLCDIAQSEAGLMISPTKRQMIESRLSRHMRSLNCVDIDAYLKDVVDDTGGMIKNELISVLTTNVSSFFREAHHFDLFERALMPKLLQRARSGGKVRIWSAGCSSGQEPYSLAMLLLSKIPDIQTLDVKILGTDIDLKILARARTATYSQDEINTLPDARRKKFTRTSNADSPSFEVARQVRDLVTIRPLNLLRSWPMAGQFDAIFCRNVLIYFDLHTQVSLWPRFHTALEDDGYLFLGHSERIQDCETFGFTPAGVTTYRKTHRSGDPSNS